MSDFCPNCDERGVYAGKFKREWLSIFLGYRLYFYCQSCNVYFIKVPFETLTWRDRVSEELRASKKKKKKNGRIDIK